MRRIIVGTIVLVLVAGCGLFDSHVKMMDQANGMAASVVDRLSADDAIGQYMASGEFIEPGVVAEVYVKYGAQAYFKGAGGQLSASAQGSLGEFVNYQEVLAIMRDKSLSENLRLAMAERLITMVIEKLAAKATTQPG